MGGVADYKMPGQLIADLLDSRGWTQRVLAVVLGVEETGINKLVSGKKPLDAEMAIALGEVLGVEAERFMDLQKSYDLAKARIVSRPDPGRATRALLFGDLPVAEMIRRGWIEAKNVRDVAKIETELARFFGVESPEEIEILPHAAKKTNVADGTTPTQLAWLYRVRAIASEMFVPSYSASSLRAALDEMRPLLIAAEATRKVPKILSDCGVRFVIVECLSGSKLDGVCFWLNDFAPVIGLSLRFDRIDNFWFVLRHEIEHLLRRHGKGAVMLDAELEGERAGAGPTIAEEERVANAAAAEFCVSQQSLDKFVARKAPFFPERDILGFARTMQLHPGLVAGQLQHRIGRYDRFRQLQAKIRSHIAPSAVVDGWGDIVPVGD
jgi:HTH-type transcriptional regulator / antitoxin HigA